MPHLDFLRILLVMTGCEENDRENYSLLVGSLPSEENGTDAVRAVTFF
jgi:hypothetical protein